MSEKPVERPTLDSIEQRLQRLASIDPNHPTVLGLVELLGDKLRKDIDADDSERESKHSFQRFQRAAARLSIVIFGMLAFATFFMGWGSRDGFMLKISFTATLFFLTACGINVKLQNYL